MSYHPTLKALEDFIWKNMATYLSDVSPDALEDGGKIFYMNGKDGTEFEWSVNGHLPPFMIFYNDEANLGAVKAVVRRDGEISLFLYGDAGKTLVKEVKTSLGVAEDEILTLAANLWRNADADEIWGAALDAIALDDAVSDETLDAFRDACQDCQPSADLKLLMTRFAFVSKKITEEGWNVGFMLRDEPEDENDSGWQFFAGDEDEDYANDPENIVMTDLGSLARLDPVVLEYLDAPVGASFVRASSDEFEEDDGQEPFMEKR